MTSVASRKELRPTEKKSPNNMETDVQSLHGLPPQEHLTLENIDTQYHAWGPAMLRLFCANGVLDIMQDAIDDKRRHHREMELEMSGQPVLFGAEAVDTPDLAKLDRRLARSKQDTQLLCRADLLIIANIGPDVFRWLKMIEDPHKKWLALKEMADQGCDIDANTTLIDRNEAGVRLSDFTTVEEYVHAAMDLRAEYAVVFGSSDHYDLVFKKRLVAGASTVILGLEEVLKEKEKEWAEDYQGSGPWETQLMVPGFALLFIREAQLLWNVQRGLRSSRD